MFAPFAKVNETTEGGRELWGWATLETVDKSGEIADFDGTVKAFQEWSDETAKRTNNKSLGNVRLMHQPIAVGKTISWQPSETTVEDDKGNAQTVKGIWVGAYIPPTKPDVIRDIDEGILSAFSIGGSYAKKWWDDSKKAFRFVPKLSEYSLVDNPCVEGADIKQVIQKADVPSVQYDKELVEDDLQKEATNTEKGSESSVSKSLTEVTPAMLTAASIAAGINTEQMIKFFGELSKAVTPGGKVDGDGDNDDNKEFPNKDENAADQSKAEEDAKKDGVEVEEAAKDDDGMEEAAKDDGGDMEAAAKFVSGIVGEELTKAGATISEATREKLHKAASHIHDTCKCAKCMKAASIYAGEDGTNNGEEPQQPPVKKEELVTDLQKAVGFSFAEELGKAGFAKQDDLSKFSSDVSELAKSVGSITETLTKVSESVAGVVSQVEAVSKSVKAIEEAPTQGGPLLFGANGQPQAQPVQKSAMDMEIDALNKAFEATNDPNLKDVLGRKLAILEHKNNR